MVVVVGEGATAEGRRDGSNSEQTERPRPGLEKRREGEGVGVVAVRGRALSARERRPCNSLAHLPVVEAAVRGSIGV